MLDKISPETSNALATGEARPAVTAEMAREIYNQPFNDLLFQVVFHARSAPRRSASTGRMPKRFFPSSTRS